MSGQSAQAKPLRLTQKDVDAICARHDRLWAARPGGARAVFAWHDLSGLDCRAATCPTRTSPGPSSTIVA